MGPVPKRVALLAVPCVLLLSGCGVAGTEFNPGVAVRVGDETISTDRIDELTSRYCGAVEEQVVAGGQSIPLAGFKGAIAAQLALKSAAEQIADDFGVSLSSEYRTQLTQIVQQADSSGYEGDERDAYIEVQSTQPLYIDLLTQVGGILLADEGEEDPTIDFQQARGQDELAAWSEREGVSFDPRYGLEVVEGLPTPTDTDLAFAQGDLAKAGKALQTATEPDPTYIAALPTSATCG
jgi:hypothetical protein